MGEKIAVVMRLKQQCRHIESILRKYGYPYPAFELGVEDEHTDRVAELLQREGVKVIITGRTIPGRLVEKLNLLHTPIIRGRLTFIRVIEKALQQVDKVAIVLATGIYFDVAKEVASGYDERVLAYGYHDREEIPGFLDDALSQGVSGFIGAATLLQEAQRRHLLSFEIPFEADDVLYAVRTAAYNLRVLENQLASDALLRAVWNNMPSGILTLDNDNRISGVNDSLLHMLRCSSEELVGRSLPQTALSVLDEVRTQDKSISTSSVVELGDTVVAVTYRPIAVEKSVMMTLVTLESVQQVQQLEQKIRRRLYHKGNVASAQFSGILGTSPALTQAVRDAKRFAAVDSSVVVQGETGVGKEMFVQSIHNASARQEHPFVAVNCAALPESLLESILFGYEKGAFTGASQQGKRGLFEIAHQGTLFLDEIGEMPLTTQARFLRVLQEKEVMPLGGDRVIPVDVRVIAATNRDLLQMVTSGTFRSDLYYRISVLGLRVPPLRERPEDIRVLAQYRLFTMRRSLNEVVETISPEALAYLCSLPLEGNVRQLFNIVERAIILGTGPELDLEAIQSSAAIFYRVQPKAVTPSADEELLAVRQAREQAIRKALKASGYHRGNAAKLLGISYSTLYRRMKELEIDCYN